MATPPALTGFSTVPSLQTLGAQHSAAMAASSGSAVVVGDAVQHELDWAAENLDSLINALTVHEADLAGALSRTGRRGVNLAMSLGATAHNFTARPAFHAGRLRFTPPALTTEPGTPAEALLGQFSGTNDAAAVAAADYWHSYAAQMDGVAQILTTIAGQLTAENTGEVFTAASTMLGQLGSRAANVSASSTIIAGHLHQLPAIKTMAVAQLQAIVDSTAAITDPVRREMVQQAETKAFLTGSYLPQLTTAVPAVQQLTVPLHGGMPAAATGVPTMTRGTSHIPPTFDGAGALRAATAAATSAPSAADAVAPATSTIAEAAPAGAGTLNSASMAPATTAAATTGTPGTASGIPAPAGMAPTASTPAAGGQSPTGSGASMPGPLNPAALNITASGAGPAKPGGSSASASRDFGTGQTGRDGIRPGTANPGGINTGAGIGTGAGALRGGTGFGTGTGGTSQQDPHASSRPGTTGHASQATAGAGARGAAGPAHGVTGAAMMNPNRRGGHDGQEPNTHHIRHVPQKWEQDRFQRELFGDRPVTVPGVIGVNVCRTGT